MPSVRGWVPCDTLTAHVVAERSGWLRSPCRRRFGGWPAGRPHRRGGRGAPSSAPTGNRAAPARAGVRRLGRRRVVRARRHPAPARGRCDRVAGFDVELPEGELRLVRDVLDTQIIDVAGKRLARVSEVLLTRIDATLRVAAVEVGAAGVWRRLGVQRLAEGRSEQAVDWRDLHLTSAARARPAARDTRGARCTGSAPRSWPRWSPTCRPRKRPRSSMRCRPPLLRVRSAPRTRASVRGC